MSKPSEWSWHRPCPAKLNLTLAVLGKRGDGFHRLQSIIAQTAFGDDLYLRLLPPGEADRLTVAGPEKAPVGKNLVLKALHLFRERFGFPFPVHFHLEKRIPPGAGLGGGSSDAVAALRLLARASTDPPGKEKLHSLALDLGSDCPLFLVGGPVLLKGRGESVEELPAGLKKRLAGKRVFIAMPPWETSTGQAFDRLAVDRAYSPVETAEDNLGQWVASGAVFPPPLNDFQPVLERRYPAYPVLLDHLAATTGFRPRLTGSGSAIWGDPAEKEKEIRAGLEAAWGPFSRVFATILK